jgi:hypothetical protein
VFGFAIIMMNSNPFVAASPDQSVRLSDAWFICGFMFALLSMLIIIYQTIVYEYRIRMFRGHNKYFNRIGIYIIMAPLWVAMLLGLVGDVIYGATKVVQSVNVTSG